jgi:hypothetical protein
VESRSRSTNSPLGALKKAVQEKTEEAARVAAAESTVAEPVDESALPEPEIPESQETITGQIGEGHHIRFVD